MNIKTLLLAGSLFFSAVPAFAQSGDPILWYQQPAPEWMEALPLGNGRLGASVYGGIDTDRIALNEITMWAGQRDEEQNDHCGPEKLAEIRKAFFAGDLEEGNRLTNEYLHGFSKSFGTHLPLGDLVMEFSYPDKKISGYRRELNLENAVAKTTFKSGDVTYTREYICDYPDDVMAVRISADKPGAVTMTLSTDLLRKSDLNVSDKGIILTGKVDYPMFGPGGVAFAGDLRVAPKGGKVSHTDNSVKVEGADEVIVLVDVRTDFDNPDYRAGVSRTVDKALALGFDRLRANHTTDHSNLFNRMAVNFGESDNSHLPTDT
ncbi:MAG: glycoside hydrolase family 95 protein, partial [Muribaculaceae bacterium]|nr:glycoside hydrolase family 95 protein [Muribaculaceae bacterium]